MSPRRPPHISLNPVALTFPHRVTLEEPIRLRQGEISIIWCMSDEHLERNHTVFKAIYLGQQVLLRRTPISSLDHETKVHHLLHALEERGAPVLPLLEPPVQFDRHCYSVQPYIEHHLYCGALTDLEALGTSLKKLSDAFIDLPQWDAPKAHIVDIWTTGAMASSIEKTAHETCSSTFSHMRRDGGIAHNDLHPGNVLFGENGNVIIIDFEESMIHQSHPMLDFHAAVERFVLVHQPSSAKLNSAIQLLSDTLGPYESSLFQAIGIIKNTHNMSLARASGLDSELKKFAHLKKLWLAL